MQPPLDWLLDADPEIAEPWLAYRTLRDLLGRPDDDPEVAASREATAAHPAVRALIEGLADWPGEVVASHRSAGQPYHRLAFLAELGLRADDPGMPLIIDRILGHRSHEGPFRLPMNISPAHGGTGRQQFGWALCDAPVIVGALAQLGLADHPAVLAAINHLEGLVREVGWPCAVSPELGKWRGPGRAADPCPYANLVMLRALSAFPDRRASPACHVGAETLLQLWADSRTRHPYIFYMGNDFRKLKAPLLWYDLLHVLDVLARFPWLRDDPRLLDMLAVLRGKADPQGRFTPESVYTWWKEWDFGQKRAPSRTITLVAWRIIGRIEGASA